MESTGTAAFRWYCGGTQHPFTPTTLVLIIRKKEGNLYFILFIFFFFAPDVCMILSLKIFNPRDAICVIEGGFRKTSR